MLTTAQEDGVNTAIQAIYRDMEYAKTLVKRHKGAHDPVADDSEETWTFVGDESDAELKRGLEMDMHALHQRGSSGAMGRDAAAAVAGVSDSSGDGESKSS